MTSKEHAGLILSFQICCKSSGVNDVLKKRVTCYLDFASASASVVRPCLVHLTILLG